MAPRGSTGAALPDAPDLVTPATVTKIIDGDSLKVRLGSGPEEVRVFGIDAPEARQPYGREAGNALRRMVDGRDIELQPVEDNPRDRYDRLIAVVYADGVNVSEELVADGLAWAYRRYLGQVAGAESLCRLEAAARAARKGLWSQPSERWVPPWIYRERARALPGARVPSKDYSRETAEDCIAAIGKRGAPTAVEEPQSLATPASPARGTPNAGCRIKGNINRQGDKIYHLPGSHSYDDTRIDTAQGERWFCSEAEARAAGWRAAR